MRIRCLQPTVDINTRQEVINTLRSGWLGNGPKVKQLEEKVAKMTGKKYAVATNSATAALHISLKAHKIEGGELITTPMTFVSDAIVGEWQGMDVTFSDIDEDTLCLDPDKLNITGKTKAIIAVDSHGRLADVKRIKENSYFHYAVKNRPLIIEDAAHAMFTPGIGVHADILILSFQAVKTCPIGDGGMVLTDSKEIYDEINNLKWLNVEKSTYDRHKGKKYSWDYDITRADGIKAYMNDIEATIALGQLKRLEAMTERRRAIQLIYNNAFIDIFPIITPEFSHTVQYYTIKCIDRDGLSDYLASKGIDTSVHFKPLSEMTYWKKSVRNPLPVTNRVWKLLLTLPCHDALTPGEQEYVIDCVRDFYG